MKNNFKILCLSCILGALYTNTSFAKNDDFNAKLSDLQKQINELKKANNNSSDVLSLLDGLDIGGRIHINGTWKDAKKDSSSDLSVKRARLTVNKQINNWELQLQADFAGNGTYLEENYLAYHFNDNSSIKIGQTLIPGFLEREKTTDDMSTILWNSEERLGWIPAYLIGINYSYRSNNFGFSGGIYGNGVDNEEKSGNYINYNTTARTWYSPINNEDSVVMIGLNGMYQDMKDKDQDPSSYSYSAYGVSKQMHVGLELFLQWKNLYLASEYMNTSFKFYNAPKTDAVKVGALSSEFVWNITSEKTYYDGEYGVYGGVEVANPVSKGGFGAFQFVSRYSQADGKTGYLLETKDYTFGINWLPEDNVKFLFGFSKVEDKDFAGNKKDYNFYQVEARYFF